jgi:type I restriction enzyme S subunit
MTSFVPMEAVSDVHGEVERYESKTFAKLKKGYTYFEDGDVIFAKITPCMQNGKHAIVQGLTDGFGFGSTEFHVIRPLDGVMPEWIHYFLRRKETLDAAVKTFTGAVGQQRVPPAFLSNLALPLPPLAEQRRITTRLKAQLAEVETARQAAQAQVRDALLLRGRLLQATFDGLVGTAIKPLGDWISSYRNGFGKRPREGETGPIVLRIADVSSGIIDVSQPRRGAVSSKEADTYRLQADDLLFIRVNGSREIVGRCCIVDPEVPADTIFNDHLIRVRLGPGIDAEYARFCAGAPSVRARIEEAASTSAGQLTINQEVIAAIDVPDCSLDEQRRIVARLKAQLAEAEAIHQAAAAQLAEIERLPQRLLAQAFAPPATQGDVT